MADDVMAPLGSDENPHCFLHAIPLTLYTGADPESFGRGRCNFELG